MNEMDTDNSNPSILIVDDIPANLHFLLQVLSAEGYQVRPANNGKAALQLVERITPDLIILDIQMPEMDGFEVCRQLKANPASRDIPVIFLSALKESADIVTAFEVGGVDYVQKPFIAEELLARVRTQLSLHEFRQQLAVQNHQLQQEISERIQIEAALKENEQRLDLALSTAKAGAWTLDVPKNTSWWDENVRGIFGYKSEPLNNYADHWQSVVHPDDRQMALTAFKQAFETTDLERTAIEYRIRSDSGEKHILEQLFIQRDKTGQAIRTIGLTQDISEIKASEALLVEQQKKLATIDERQRLARDLHDSVAQSIHSQVLFSKTLVAALDREDYARAQQVAGFLSDSARQSIKEMRLMLFEMSQPEDDETLLDLPQAIETRLQAVEIRSGLEASLHVSGATKFNATWRENLYWLTMEALNNALKHAQAERVAVNLIADGKHFTLEIKDDGVGFDPIETTISGGMGLGTMRSRAEALNGILTIESAPETGTIVRFRGVQ